LRRIPDKGGRRLSQAEVSQVIEEAEAFIQHLEGLLAAMAEEDRGQAGGGTRESEEAEAGEPKS
jgi:hypothetical protein